jgi:small ligand-binding sensory domain FIST
MRFHSAVSEQDSALAALETILDQARESLDAEPDVAFLFFTGHHLEDADALVGRAWRELEPQALVGCSAEGVIGAEREVERKPGMALLVGSLPGVRVHAFHVGGDDWHDVLSGEEEFVERVGCGPETRCVLGFGDPFSTPVNRLLPAFDQWAAGAPLVGGMASAARQPGGNVLVCNDAGHDGGFVGLSLSGPLSVETVVSQGCRPVGRPFVITRSRENVIEQLGGRPAMEALRATVAELDEPDRRKLANGLFVGRAISEYRETFGRGDFLVRNVIGVDQETGALAVTDYVRTGQTVQFHVRDAATASEDLAAMLEAQSAAPNRPAGGLLFSCNGRGSRMFRQACHDVGAARRAMPQTPLAGFFAAGELGPVGGKNFIHGHTASFALFRPAGA